MLKFSLLVLFLGIVNGKSNANFKVNVINSNSVDYNEKWSDVIDTGNTTKKSMGNIWAVLVAGSNGYYNYRHQADICHAYQILHSHGVPDERIIVMMYDDIANSTENPTPGVIINQPNGTNVYEGVLKDYVGEDVTPQNFLNILAGNAKAMSGIGSGKVLKSGPNDHVFVNFADHGAPGLVAFPNGELYSNDLYSTILQMRRQNMYSKLVFYVEACESGSMFDNILATNINVFATTAANPDESSYACYYDELRQTYLGDVYSVNWMEDTDKEVISTETLQKQFQIVQEETNTSHVMEYGDIRIGKLDVSEFQGRKSADSIDRDASMTNALYDAVPSPEVAVEIIKRKLENTNIKVEQEKLLKQLLQIAKGREFLDDVVKKITLVVTENSVTGKMMWTEKQRITNFDCQQLVTMQFSKACFNLSKNDYALRYVYVLVNLCEFGYSVPTINSAINTVCTHPTRIGII